MSICEGACSFCGGKGYAQRDLIGADVRYVCEGCGGTGVQQQVIWLDALDGPDSQRRAADSQSVPE